MRHTPYAGRAVLAVFTAALLVGPAAVVTAQESDYPGLLADLLDGFQRVMITEPADDPLDGPGASWSIVGNAIRRGFVRFVIDPMNESTVDGARFFASPDEEVAKIYISLPLLEIAQERPAAAYGVLMGAVAEAAAFFENPETWWISQGNPLDRFLLDLRGYRIQAEMVRNRLIPNNFNPGSLGIFLADSQENDGLFGAALYLEGLSLRVAGNLNGLREAYRADGSTEALRDGVLTLGWKLLEERTAVPEGAADGLVYPAAVAVHTWLELSPPLIIEAGGTTTNGGEENFGTILEHDAAYAELRKELETYRIGDMPLIFHVMENTKAGFEIR